MNEFFATFNFIIPFLLPPLDFRHNITIQLTPSRAELNRLQVEMQNG